MTGRRIGRRPATGAPVPRGPGAPQRGQVLVLFVLALFLVLVPAAGLGIDGARVYEERRAAQIAADQAALAATREACVTGPTNAVTKGRAAALANGYDNAGLAAETGNTVTIWQPDPTGQPYAYAARVNTRIPGTFSRIMGPSFNRFDVEVTATARGAKCGSTSGGGAALGPIYAGGAGCPGGSSLNNIEISGSRHTVTGLTHTNGNFKNGGNDWVFLNAPDPAVKYVGTFQGGSNTYNGPAVDIGTVPSPPWPTGWGPNDMPAWSTTEPFWAAYRNLRRNPDANTTSLNITSSGVWYTDATGTLDVTGITAGLSMVIVAPRAAIKLPTDLSASNLTGREFTPFNDPSLPKQNVIVMSGFVPSDGKACDGFAVEKSGESGTFKGIFWAPRAMVRWSGNRATLDGCIISHSFQMNGNEHRINQNATWCAGSATSSDPEISLVK